MCFKCLGGLEDKSGFSLWLEDLGVEVCANSGGSGRENLLKILKKRASQLGYDEIITVTPEMNIRGPRDLREKVISQGKPFIDLEDLNENGHGDLSHLVQWIYVADVINKEHPGHHKEFFDFLASYPYMDIWWKVFDIAGTETLKNPGTINKLLKHII